MAGLIAGGWEGLGRKGELLCYAETEKTKAADLLLPVISSKVSIKSIVSLNRQLAGIRTTNRIAAK